MDWIVQQTFMHGQFDNITHGLFHRLLIVNAQCTPTDWQSAVGDIANCRLRIGVRR